MTTFGKFTRIKLLGGELLQGDPTQQNVVIRNALVESKRRAHDLRPVYERWLPTWLEQNRRVFAAEGLPGPWAPLSPAYAAWKAKRYPGKSILRRTDRLYESLTQRSPDTVWEITPRTIRFGTRVPYWKYHQTGTRRMPARPPLVLLDATWQDLVRQVNAYVKPEFGRG
jgi:phage gpG-like protein